MCLLIAISLDFRTQLSSPCNGNDAYLSLHQGANASAEGLEEADQHPEEVTSIHVDYG